MGSELLTEDYTSHESKYVLFQTPVQCSSSATLDLIRAYDSGDRNKLSELDRKSFETMGFISTTDFAPGPNVQSVSKSREVGFSVGGIGGIGGMGVSKTTESTTEYIEIAGKKERIDYKKLQKPPFNKAPLEWDRCQRQLLWPVEGLQTPTFTIIFE